MARGSFGSTSRGGRGGGSSFRGGSSSFRSRGRSFYRGRGRGRGGASANTPARDDEGTQLAERFEQVKLADEVDEKLGFPPVQDGPKREGWLVNMHPVRIRYLWLFFIAETQPDIGERSRLAFREGCRRLLLHSR